MDGDVGARADELSDELRAAVRRIARVPHLLVCSDYDGTLAPLVEDPTSARALPESISALRALAGLSGTTAAVISGRALRDLAALSRLPAEVHLVGSHGSEFDIGFVRALTGTASRLRTSLLGAVRGLVDGVPGILLEEKPASVAVHVRRASRQDADVVLDALRRGPGHMDGVYVTEGHEVLELSVVESDKGHAIDVLRHQAGASAAFFVGDDVTDERGFARLSGPDVGVKVGPGRTAAEFRIQGPREVSVLLALLAEERAAWLAGADATPIEDLTLLSDGINIALLTPDGDITWLCQPEADSAAVFADLLGGPGAGVLSVHPARGGLPLGQEYVGDTMVVRTRWAGLTVVDYLDSSGPDEGDQPGPHVTELVRVLEGRTAARVVFAPRPEFGGVPVTLAVEPDEAGRPLGVGVTGASEPVFLRAPGVEWEVHVDGVHETATATIDLSGGPVVLELRCGTTDTGAHSPAEASRRAATARGWSDWAAALTCRPSHAAVVRRSALTLKALCHQSTGAVLAAGTTSLPEGVGGIRNWDYRYCWVRDGAMTVRTLLALGSTAEAEAFVALAGTSAQPRPPDRSGCTRSTPCTATTLGPEAVIEQLPGYAGSRPVRVGNAAQGQVQLDVFGPVADLVAALAESRGGGRAAVRDHEWRLVQQMVAAVERTVGGARPRHLGDPRQPAAQRLFQGDVLAHRRSRARCRGAPRAQQPDWVELRARIAEQVVDQGWSEDLKAYVSAYDRHELEAASLHIGLCGLLPPDDPRFVATVDAVEDGLRRGPTVFRYLHDDGLPGIEGGMHICTAWLVESYLMVGRREDAEALFARLLELAGPTGLLPEQYEVHTERGLGNHPQAYSHLGVIRCALALAAAP